MRVGGRRSTSAIGLFPCDAIGDTSALCIVVRYGDHMAIDVLAADMIGLAGKYLGLSLLDEGVKQCRIIGRSVLKTKSSVQSRSDIVCQQCCFDSNRSRATIQINQRLMEFSS